MKRKAKRISPAKLQLLKKAGKNSKDEIKGFGYQVPPDEDIVRIYFDQKGFVIHLLNCWDKKADTLSAGAIIFKMVYYNLNSKIINRIVNSWFLDRILHCFIGSENREQNFKGILFF